MFKLKLFVLRGNYDIMKLMSPGFVDHQRCVRATISLLSSVFAVTRLIALDIFSTTHLRELGCWSLLSLRVSLSLSGWEIDPSGGVES